MRRERIKDDALEERLFLQRVLLAGALVFLLVLALSGRAFWLQVVQHAHYLELSQGNRARIEPLPPNRGVIYDRAGRLIAENTPAYQLELIREQAGDLEVTLARLVRIGLLEGTDIGRVRQLVLSRRSFEAVPILLQLGDEEIARYAVHRHELPGVMLETRLARHYPYGQVGAHALGYVGTISEDDLARVDRERYFGTGVIGKTGIERAYEDVLLGVGGYREVLVNAEGRPGKLPEGVDAQLQSREPQAGSELRLTLDIELQRIAEEAMAGRRGAVVAIDPANGDVLVFASLPSFDPNGFARGISRSDYLTLTDNPDQPLFNRVLRGTYPPGSTIKPVMALAGLEYDVVKPTDAIYCPGHYSLPNSRHRFRDWKREGHGTVDMEDAVMQSCDVYFYRLANTLGIDRIHDAMKRIGFGVPTGIDIPGERGGIMPSTQWKKSAFSGREQGRR
jgi:penicillin-binding protein 2